MNAPVPASQFAESPSSAGAVVPRATVELLVRQRDQALAKYEQAHMAMTIAHQRMCEANSATNAINDKEDRYSYHLREEKEHFMRVVDPQKRDDYMAIARRIVDVETWTRIIKITDLERLMDREEKDKLHKQLMENPPEATVDNIYATLECVIADAGMIFRRGIANCFSQLDRRFRSHDAFKIGSRVILNRMFDEHGWWNYHHNMEATLLDIERTFVVLDDKPHTYSGIVEQLRHARGRGWGPKQTEVMSDYFTVRVYKNGNAHVWFRRDDLVEKVNKLLAEYYGEVIPDAQEPEDDGDLFNPKTSLAKNYGFFPTPDAAAQKVIDKTPLYHGEDDPPLTILEPSAGTGNLARLLATARTEHVGWDDEKSRRIERRYRNDVDCVEIQPHLAQALRAEGLYRKVHNVDFLAMQPNPENLYDRVVMNPPFDRERDIDHVMHALKFLKPDGFLIAIMSAGTEFRETRKSIAFRKLIEEKKGRFDDLPAGSFSSVGTNVNTLILRLWNNGRSVSW